MKAGPIMPGNLSIAARPRAPARAIWAWVAIALGCASAGQKTSSQVESTRESAPSISTTDEDLDRFNDQLDEQIRAGRFDAALSAASDAWARGLRDGDIAFNAARAASRAQKPANALSWLNRAVDAGFSSLGRMNRDPGLTLVRQESNYIALASRVQAAVEQHLRKMQVGGGLPTASPKAEGIEPAALAKLLQEAQAAQSSALVLLRHGKLVGQWYFGGTSELTETMSATKAVTSLAVGFLYSEGRLSSLDVPVSSYFAEWKDGVHDLIRLRQLLNHTSGLHADRTTERIYASKNFVQFALGSGVDAPPGTEFFYNNNAANLVAGVVQRLSGRPMDEYLKQKLFEPLGIREVRWTRDASGNPHGMSGLQIHAVDFAKIGQLMLNRGVWNGQRILSEEWVSQSTGHPGQPFNPRSALFWWLDAPTMEVVMDEPFFRAIRERGASPDFLGKLSNLKDRRLPTSQFQAELTRIFGPDALQSWTREVGQRRIDPRTVVLSGYDGFSARGSFGQTLIVFPKRHVVAVRFTQEFDDYLRVGFPQFPDLVRALVAEDGK